MHVAMLACKWIVYSDACTVPAEAFRLLALGTVLQSHLLSLCSHLAGLALSSCIALLSEGSPRVTALHNPVNLCMMHHTVGRHFGVSRFGPSLAV